ncbi:MAG: hypothetical protein JWP20_1185 [Roseomonas sp.]|jgi:hypothetical protein|nr:hypothetical protein [Roseomonas sp.]
MALETITLPPAARRRMTFDILNGLAQGGLAERLRLDGAARILGTIRRVAEMTASGELQRGAIVPGPALAWDPAAITAREYAEAMTPAELDRLLAEAPAWAAAVLAAPEQRRAA